MPVHLRPLTDADLDLMFVWEQDPDAIAMAAFTHADPSDRAAFDEHYRRIRADDSTFARAVDDGDGLVGSVGSFTMEGDREITYWINPARWGEGLATAALLELIRAERTRPLFARVAEHNVGSATVLRRGGFVRVGQDSGFANGVGHDVVEHIYRLDA